MSTAYFMQVQRSSHAIIPRIQRGAWGRGYVICVSGCMVKKCPHFKAFSPPLSPLPLSPAQLVELHMGQGKDIYWRDSHSCPSEQEYMQMVRESEYIPYCSSYSILAIRLNAKLCMCLLYASWRWQFFRITYVNTYMMYTHITILVTIRYVNVHVCMLVNCSVEYFVVTETGGLFVLGIALMQLFSDNKT